jgi:uncharacterized protein (DUF169 family)
MEESCKKLARAIETYIHPPTYPVAIKMLKAESDIPAETERTIKTLGYQIALCQGWGKARHNAECVAMLKEDNACPTPILSLGFAEPPDLWWKADLYRGWATPNAEAAKRLASEMPRLPVGQYVGVLMAPAGACNFEPDFILLYCNPVQALRLIGTALVQDGGKFPVSVWPMGVCTTLADAVLTGECQLGIPCFGDRKFAATSDEEVVFVIPSVKFDEMTSSMKFYHENCHPITTARYVDGEVIFSREMYRKLRDMI